VTLNRVSGDDRSTKTWRINMNVIAAAGSIGLAVGDRGEMSGTIDEDVVLACERHAACPIMTLNSVGLPRPVPPMS
jgi:hypothetical protein